MPWYIQGRKAYSPGNRCVLAYSKGARGSRWCKGRTKLAAGNSAYYIIWEELALSVCAKCAKAAMPFYASSVCLRIDIRGKSALEELESTVIDMPFDELPEDSQAELIKHKKSKLKLS